MGHKLGFDPIPGVEAISATANTRGFTPLTAIARMYGWSSNLIEAAAAECNRRRETAILDRLDPCLLLVPKTRGIWDWHRQAEFLATDLLQAVNHLGIKSLHFTHYGFVQEKLLSFEVERVFSLILNPLLTTTLEDMIWDIDSRAIDQFESIFGAVKTKFRLSPDEPTRTHAAQFEWIQEMNLSEGLNVARFQRSVSPQEMH